MPFQCERQHHQSEVDSEEHKGNPPDDNLGGTEARVGGRGWCLCGNCLPVATERESISWKERQFLTGAVRNNVEQQNLLIIILLQFGSQLWLIETLKII